jgi:hypothetical protein
VCDHQITMPQTLLRFVKQFVSVGDSLLLWAGLIPPYECNYTLSGANSALCEANSSLREG